MYPRVQTYRGWGGLYRGRALQRRGMGGLNVGRHGHGFWGNVVKGGTKLLKKGSEKLLQVGKQKALDLGKKALDVGKKRALDLGKKALDVGKKKAKIIGKQALDLGRQKAKDLLDVGKQKASQIAVKAIGKQATQKLKEIVGQDATQEVKKQINRLPAKRNQVRGKSNKVSVTTSKRPAAPVSVADQPIANPVVNVPHTATTPSVGRRRRRRKHAAKRSTSRWARISRRTRSRRHIFM